MREYRLLVPTWIKGLKLLYQEKCAEWEKARRAILDRVCLDDTAISMDHQGSAFTKLMTHAHRRELARGKNNAPFLYMANLSIEFW